MLAWLVLTIAALMGLFIVVEGGGHSSVLMSPFLVAFAVASTLALAYLLTGRSPHGPERYRRLRAASLAVAVVACVASVALMRPASVVDLLANDVVVAPVSTPAVGVQNPISVRIRRGADGRFVTRVIVNDLPVDMLVDTGASSVMLRASDATAAGIDIAALSFNTAMSTANGMTYAAPIRLRSVRVGLLQLNDVEAFIAKPGSLNESLLGSSFLRRLRSYDLTGNFITLRN